MATVKEEKIKEALRHAAAAFLELESNKLALITVTNVRLAGKGREATIFFTVYPEEKQVAALEFAKRKRSEFREYLKGHTKMMRLPFIDFAIDLGEKNRQRIDELSRR